MNMHDRPQAQPGLDWASRNQQWLAAQLAALRLRLARQLRETSANAEPPPPECGDDFEPALDALTKLFGLSAFERDVVLLAAGVELDSCAASPRRRGDGASARSHREHAADVQFRRADAD